MLRRPRGNTDKREKSREWTAISHIDHYSHFIDRYGLLRGNTQINICVYLRFRRYVIFQLLAAFLVSWLLSCVRICTPCFYKGPLTAFENTTKNKNNEHVILSWRFLSFGALRDARTVIHVTSSGYVLSTGPYTRNSVGGNALQVTSLLVTRYFSR